MDTISCLTVLANFLGLSLTGMTDNPGDNLTPMPKLNPGPGVTGINLLAMDPIRFNDDKQVDVFFMGTRNACAIMTDSSVVCWGLHGRYRLCGYPSLDGNTQYLGRQEVPIENFPPPMTDWGEPGTYVVHIALLEAGVCFTLSNSETR